MAHYAKLDENNIVISVVVMVSDDLEMAIFRRTSYNTRGGIHTDGGTPFRKNYAGIGYSYDAGRDAFIAPKPFPSWVLNETTCLWEPPVAMPTDGGFYTWDEAAQEWAEAV